MSYLGFVIRWLGYTIAATLGVSSAFFIWAPSRPLLFTMGITILILVNVGWYSILNHDRAELRLYYRNFFLTAASFALFANVAIYLWQVFVVGVP